MTREEAVKLIPKVATGTVGGTDYEVVIRDKQRWTLGSLIMQAGMDRYEVKEISITATGNDSVWLYMVTGRVGDEGKMVALAREYFHVKVGPRGGMIARVKGKKNFQRVKYPFSCPTM